MSKEENEVEQPSEILGSTEVEYATETSRRNVFFWAMYDLANTIYSMVIVSLIINKYVLVIAQLEHGMSYGSASFLYGTVSTLMQLGVAICVPILGALSDNVGKRKPFVISLTGIILLFASLLGFFHDLTTVLILFVIANVAYQFSLTFYDAMLPFIAKREDIGKVAGFGVAWGYLGTILALVIMIPFIFVIGDLVSSPPVAPGDPPIAYGFAGGWVPFALPMYLFLLCAIPFVYVREKQKTSKRPPLGQLVKSTFKQLGSTFKDIRKHKSMFVFIIGYFFVADIANVIVLYMTPIVTDGLVFAGGSNLYAILFIIISTMSAVGFTYFVGKFGEKYGAKNTFFLVGGLWGIALIIGIVLVFSTQSIDVGANLPFILTLIMGVVAGPALGGTWTAQRIMVTELAPKEKFGEFFGFSKLSGKFSSALGPFVWGTVMLTYDIIGKAAYGWAMISVGIIMAIGIVIIAFVKKE
ncbi:MAG: MFS transporter [Promethearchaeota archaeon]|nr:MAG: MFS transporter [Candidatus Lokiarchaeota archaeon]